MAPTPSRAGPAADALGQCLSDNTTGRDRKDLAKWMFVGMAAHPEIRAFAPVSAESTEAAQKAMGLLFTRLVGTSCAKEAKATYVSEGQAGANAAFELLGKLAMGELTSNPDVGNAIGGFVKFADKEKLQKILSP